MCQICDVIGAQEIVIPEGYSAKLKEKIESLIEKPILERIKTNIVYRLGNAIEEQRLLDAVEALFNRDYKEKKQIFVPEQFLTKIPKMMFHDSKGLFEKLAERMKLEKHFPQMGKWQGLKANVDGEALEKKVYTTLKDYFQKPEHKDEQVLVLHGYEIMDLKMESNKIEVPHWEKDFIIINLTHGYILNIEVKSTPDFKTLDSLKVQLENTKRMFEQWFAADLNPEWKFFSAVYCENATNKKGKKNRLCDNYDKDFVFTSSEDFITKLEKIHRDPHKKTDEYLESYNVMVKFLLFFATYHPAPVSSLIDTKIKDTIDNSVTVESLSFWNWTPEQKSLFDAEICRVIMTSHWSTGKTRIMFEKAKILAKEGKRVIFVLHHSQFLEEESNYFQDNAPILLYLCLLNEIDPEKAKNNQKLKKSMETIKSNLELLVTNNLAEVLDKANQDPSVNIFIDECTIANEEDMKIVDEIGEKIEKESNLWVTVAKASAKSDNLFRTWLEEKEKDEKWFVPSLSHALRNSKEIIVFEKKEFELIENTPNDMEEEKSELQPELPAESPKIQLLYFWESPSELQPTSQLDQDPNLKAEASFTELKTDQPNEQIPQTTSEEPINENPVVVPNEPENSRIGCQVYALPSKSWPQSDLKIPTNLLCGYEVEDPVEHSSYEPISFAMTKCFQSLAQKRVVIIVFSPTISPELIKEIEETRQQKAFVVDGNSKYNDGE